MKDARLPDLLRLPHTSQVALSSPHLWTNRECQIFGLARLHRLLLRLTESLHIRLTSTPQVNGMEVRLRVVPDHRLSDRKMELISLA
jgi:hypothetical protein